jgi:hypothetical protein
MNVNFPPSEKSNCVYPSKRHSLHGMSVSAGAAATRLAAHMTAAMAADQATAFGIHRAHPVAGEDRQRQRFHTENRASHVAIVVKIRPTEPDLSSLRPAGGSFFMRSCPQRQLAAPYREGPRTVH